MQSAKPRKQRKSIFLAPLHKRNKLLHAHLSKELRNKYHIRSIRVRTGDSVIVIRGDSKGHEGKVARVDAERGFIYIEGLTMKDSRGRTILKPIHASKVIVTKLDLSDERRRTKLEALSKTTISSVQAGEQS
ncbi:MAG: 50S ribosomal protein L24 [Thermoprotei archaeon]|jgi:large subunit ribosomal protein L24